MQWFRAVMTAGLVAAGVGVCFGPGAAALADEPRALADKPSEPHIDTGLQEAAYDVIIVPRNGNGAPRVLTERGWRSLAPRSLSSRSLSPRRPRATYMPRQAMPFRERQTWANPYFNRPMPAPPSAFRSYGYDDVRPATRTPRGTGYDTYRRPGFQRAY